MDLTGKLFDASNRKNNRKRLSILPRKKTVERKDSESNKLTFPLQTERIKLNKTWENCFQIGIVRTLQNWN